MKTKIGSRLSKNIGLYEKVQGCLRVVEEVFGGFVTANAQIELGKDSRGRDIVRLIIKDHGRTVQTGFAPDEFDNVDHFRNRCYQFVEQVTRLEIVNDCPNCGMKYGAKPLPFKCDVCGFQTVQACPQCGEEVSIGDYLVEGSTLWKCPKCKKRVRAEYTEPMFDTRGFFSQPLVELSVAESPTSANAN